MGFLCSHILQRSIQALLAITMPLPPVILFSPQNWRGQKRLNYESGIQRQLNQESVSRANDLEQARPWHAGSGSQRVFDGDLYNTRQLSCIWPLRGPTSRRASKSQAACMKICGTLKNMRVLPRHIDKNAHQPIQRSRKEQSWGCDGWQSVPGPCKIRRGELSI